jgi:hypothetical protein
MKRASIGVVVLAAAVCVAFAHEAFHGPTELIYYDRDKAANGYVMFSARPRLDDHEFTYLIDMEGNVVHKWRTITAAYRGKTYFIEKTARLTEKGTIIQGIMTETGAKPGSLMQELDWNGNPVREFIDRREGYIYHHSFKRIWNKKLNDWTIVFTSQIPMTQQQAVAAGADPSRQWNAAPDGVVEMDMNGNVVWEWWTLDHVVQDKNPSWPNYGIIKDHPEKIDLNWGAGLRGNFTHQNALDYNETLDQIVVSNSTMSEFYVIDHGNTFVAGNFAASKARAAGPAGDILYRWGNPNVYDSGKGPSYEADGNRSSEGDQQLHFHHDIQWVKDGLPGAGNFLVFNNGARRAGGYRSEVVEINPYAGTYPNAGYLSEIAAGGASKQRVWNFTSVEPNSFYSAHISGVQRLPNGNTLVMSGRHGHIFQVTREREVVWEYIVPVMDIVAPNATLKDIYKKVISDKDHNWTFAAHWYPADHPGLAGRDLSPKGKITDILAQASGR